MRWMTYKLMDSQQINLGQGVINAEDLYAIVSLNPLVECTICPTSEK